MSRMAMINWRLFSLSLSLGIMITAVSFQFSNGYGEFVLWPGRLPIMFVNFILILIPTGDYYLSLPQYSYVPVNVFVYAIGVYGIVALLPSVRESLFRKDASKFNSAGIAKEKHPEPDGRA